MPAPEAVTGTPILTVTVTVEVHDPRLQRISAQLTNITRKLDTMATKNQADLDAIVAAIDTATTGIRADIQELKDAATAGQALDWSGLDAKVEALGALDAENPALPPVV